MSVGIYNKRAVSHKGVYILMKVTELKQDHIIVEWLQTMNAKPNTEEAIYRGCRTLQNTQEKTLKPYKKRQKRTSEPGD